MNLEEFLPQPRDIFKGFGAAFLYSVIVPIIQTTVMVIFGIIGMIVLKEIPASSPTNFIFFFVSMVFSTVFVSMVFSTIIGMLFGRYSTYEKGSRKPFKNFAIGFFIGVNFFGSIIFLRPNFLGIHLAVLAYTGCILGEKWKARQAT